MTSKRQTEAKGPEKQRGSLLWVTGAFVAALVALYWLFTPAPLPEPTPASARTAGSEATPTSKPAPRPPVIVQPPSLPLPTEDTGAKNTPLPPSAAVTEALHRFQFTSLPAIDGCTGGPAPGPRFPQRILLHFRRAEAPETGGPATEDRFIATEASLVPTPEGKGPGAPPSQVVGCLNQLVGKDLRVPLGTVPEDTSEFSQTIELPLPSAAH